MQVPHGVLHHVDAMEMSCDDAFREGMDEGDCRLCPTDVDLENARGRCKQQVKTNRKKRCLQQTSLDKCTRFCDGDADKQVAFCLITSDALMCSSDFLEC